MMERMKYRIGLALMVGVMVFGAGVAFERLGTKLSAYPLLSPARIGRDQSDFLVVFRPLRIQLEEIVKSWEEKGVMVGVQIEYLNTGTHLSINQNTRILPASLTKVPVAMMVMHRVEEGEIAEDLVLELRDEDRDSKWGELYKAPAGTKLGLMEVVEKSLVESDNTAHKMLYRLVEVDEAEDMSQELNLEDLFDDQGRITAREYARLLRSLYNSSYLQAGNSQQILEWMAGDQAVEFAKSGLPEGVKYAHKFGESSAVKTYLDAGIVYVPNRPYILVVVINGFEEGIELSREQVVKEIFEPISRLTYDYIVSYRQ